MGSEPVTVNVQVTETPEARMKNLLKAAFDEIPEHEKVIYFIYIYNVCIS